MPMLDSPGSGGLPELYIVMADVGQSRIEWPAITIYTYGRCWIVQDRVACHAYAGICVCTCVRTCVGACADTCAGMYAGTCVETFTEMRAIGM